MISENPAVKLEDGTKVCRHEIMPVTSGTRYSIVTWFV